MNQVSRKVVAPVVIGIWVLTALVALYVCAMLPWFTDYCDFYQTRGDGTYRLAGIATAFLRFHLIGVPLGLTILGCGVNLLRLKETNSAHLAWYVSVSVSLLAIYQTSALLAERSLYELLFPL